MITLFHKHFVKTGLVSSANARALSRSFEKRQKTDYADFVSVTVEEAQALRRETDSFVAECEALLTLLVAES